MTSPRLAPETKPNRRRFQFSLRTLLILVTLSSFPLAWFGYMYRESETTAWVREMGGSVVQQGRTGESYLPVLAIDLGDTKVSDLSPLVRLSFLEKLWIFNTQVSDLTPLKELTNLEYLSLAGSPVRDFTPLRELRQLRWLFLDNTQVRALAQLNDFSTLRKFGLTSLEDCDLTPLKGIANLELTLNAQVRDLSRG